MVVSVRARAGLELPLLFLTAITSVNTSSQMSEDCIAPWAVGGARLLRSCTAISQSVKCGDRRNPEPYCGILV